MTHDDPKLTAYALDELDAADRAEVEAFLKGSDAGRRFVEETRQTVALLAGGLRAVEPPALTAAQRDAVHAAARSAGVAPPLSYGRVDGRRSAFARWSLATAACAALVAGGYSILTHRTPRLDRADSAQRLAPHAAPADRAATSPAINGEGRKVPYTDVLRYPEAWPELQATNEKKAEPGKDEGRFDGAAAVVQGGEVVRGKFDRPADKDALAEGLKLDGTRVATGASRQPQFGGGGAPGGAGFGDQQQGQGQQQGGGQQGQQPGQQGTGGQPGGGGAMPAPTPPAKWNFGGVVTNGAAPAQPAGPDAYGLQPGGSRGGYSTALGDAPVAAGATPAPPSVPAPAVGPAAKPTSPAGGAQREEKVTQLSVVTKNVSRSESEGDGLVDRVSGVADPALGVERAKVVEAEARFDPRMKLEPAGAKNPVTPAFQSKLDEARDAVQRKDLEAARALVLDARKEVAEQYARLPERERLEVKLRLQQVEQTIPGTESYAGVVDNPFKAAVAEPLSTFSIDVDTASYSNVRRFVAQGQLPPADAVRIEELLNYFPYAYGKPAPGSKEPFRAAVEVATCPWNAKNRLARVSIKGREIAHDKRPVSNLVFLIDVSGSMNEPKKLPLVKEGLKGMVNELTENDRVAIVVYAGAAGLALPSTCADPKSKQAILDAIDRLSAGGSTNGAQGIELAYQLATEHFIKGGTNRVLLATDGDWNVGITDQTSLTKLIEEKAKSGVFLSLLGFGYGNLKDDTLERLADKGNGHYAYIDDAKEARKVLVEEMSGTLVTIAKDVKIQVEFNPAKVESYRLIGYENRVLRNQDFNDDRVDAGEIGAGHCVTALYEITPVDPSRKALTTAPVVQPAKDDKDVDPLKYVAGAKSDDLLTLKLRYKQPDGDESTKIESVAKDAGLTYAKASEDFKFAAAVAQYGMILRNSPYKGTATLDGVIELADEGKGKDEKGHRADFLELVKKTKGLVK
jgi:Ca-activated chloride channel family protein